MEHIHLRTKLKSDILNLRSIGFVDVTPRTKHYCNDQPTQEKISGVEGRTWFQHHNTC